ncbi:MAG: phosphoribosylanthranilate isomerase [Pseudobutyrivibrio sp.]|nr:phosphoribosylanthranilate isomerase [Pseudobutyrivibrio sp.]
MKQVKICGLFRPEDIEAVSEIRPDYAGFILDFPKSHRSIDVNRMKSLKKGLDPRIKTVAVLVDKPVEMAAGLVKEGLADILQLHGNEDNRYIETLKNIIPEGTPIWQAIQIKSDEDIDRANNSRADFVILDAGQGTGKSFDWTSLKGINRAFGLAGGINASNIDEAMKTDAVLVDISGGAETDRLKDPVKIEKLVKKAKEDKQNG